MRRLIGPEADMLSSHYAILLEHINTGALLVDNQRRIVESNPAANRMLSAREGGLSGKSLLEATLSYEMLTLLNTAQQTGEPQQQEVRRIDPILRTLDVRIFPLASGTVHAVRHGEPMAAPIARAAASSRPEPRFLLLMEDMTELRRLETVRRDFVANVSHELRTPLASIRAMTETLQDGAINDTAVSGRFLQIIVGEVERLTRILEDLLVLSRAESGIPERNTFSLDRLIVEVVERFQPQASKADIGLAYVSSGSLIVQASHDLIEQVLVNLVDNAIKYTGSGGSIEVKAAEQDGMIRVGVTDSGVGIMSQDLPRIFERFYRVDKARSRHSGGTGLGLAIVKHIVEMHGGKVTVESEYGHGSTFIFTLPVSARPVS